MKWKINIKDSNQELKKIATFTYSRVIKIDTYDILFLSSAKKNNFNSITVGDNFTYKRFFTDEPLIKTQNEYFR